MEVKEKVSVAPETNERGDGYPGIVNLRTPKNIDPYEAKAWNEDVYRLHIEQVFQTDMLKESRKSGDSTKVFSCDILIPGSLTLSALHEMIQAQFVEEKELSHYFHLPKSVWDSLTEGDTAKWCSLVGVLFQSPFMKAEKCAWEKIEGQKEQNTGITEEGRYTGPYVSENHGEGIYQSWLDMHEAMQCYPIAETALEKVPELIQTPIDHLLERLPVDHVLAFHGKDCQDVLAEGERCFSSYASFMHEDLEEDIADILFFGKDESGYQPSVDSPTDTIFYTADAGSTGFTLQMTGSKDAVDLIEKGLVTEEELAQAVAKVLTEYCPVCMISNGKIEFLA